MKISELIELLKEVKDELGDKDIGMKIEKDSNIFIEEIQGISYTGFEGLNLTTGIE